MISKPTVTILLALSILLFFPKLSMPFLDPDEGLYATIAQEMLNGGDWVIPHVNGLPYMEKPPLYFWLTALTFWFVGPSEWATRFWSALPALGTVILTKADRTAALRRARGAAGRARPRDGRGQRPLCPQGLDGRALRVLHHAGDVRLLARRRAPGPRASPVPSLLPRRRTWRARQGVHRRRVPPADRRVRHGRDAQALLARSQSGPRRGALRGGRRSVARARGLALADAVRVLRRGQPPPSVPRRARVRRGRRAELDARLPRRQLSLGLTLERLRPGAPGAGRLTPRALASGHRDLATRRRRAFRALTLQARVLRAARLPGAGGARRWGVGERAGYRPLARDRADRV